MTISCMKRAAGVLLTTWLAAGCVSHQHKAEPGTILSSPDCGVVTGSYSVEPGEDRTRVADLLFDAQEPVETLTISRTDAGVTIHGVVESGAAFNREIPERHACVKSVLIVVLSDSGGGDGIVAQASDRKLELYSTEEGTLNLRFIDTDFALLFIVPLYQSSDVLITVRRQTGIAG